MKDHFLIVAGHLDTKNKEQIAIKLFEKLKKINNIKICYCTHLFYIPESIIEIVDYIVYDKENPILNWDITNNITKTFQITLTLGNKLQSQFDGSNTKLIYYPPYHGYAHFLSMCAGVSIGASSSHDKFTFLNYDLNNEKIFKLYDNIEKINENKCDGIFYEYKVNNSKQICFNTELFTFNLKFAQTLINYRNLENFLSFDTIILENVISNICRKNNLKIHVNEEPLENNTLGLVPFGHNSNLKYFIPFETVYLKNIQHDFVLFPFKDENEYKFFWFAQNIDVNDEIFYRDFKLYIDDNFIKSNEIVSINKNSKLSFFHKNKKIRDFQFNDEKHFGYKK